MTSWDQWLAEVAQLLDLEPEDVLALFRVRELLYNAGAAPKEAADFIRQGGF